MTDTEKKTEHRGRRTKLTRKIIKKICTLVEKGATYRASALACGISERAFYDWLSRGKEDKSGIYNQFLQSLNEASARWETEITTQLTSIIRDNKDGRVALEMLRRRNPSEWNIPERSEVATSGDMTFVVDLGGERDN